MGATTKPLPQRAKEKDEDQRHFTVADLGSEIGVTQGAAYLLKDFDDGEDVIMVVTDIENRHPETTALPEHKDGKYARNRRTPKDEFVKHTFAIAELYRIEQQSATTFFAYDDPHDEVALPAKALGPGLPRVPLTDDGVSMDNGYIAK